MNIKKDILDILCCSFCKGKLTEKNNKLICNVCSLNYEIKNDIPVLIVEKALLPKSFTSLEDFKLFHKNK